VPLHELVEPVGGVLAPGVGGQQRVEVGQHLAYSLASRWILAGQRLLHPGELRVEHLSPQHRLDLFVRLPGLVGLPVVGRQLAHRPRGVVRQCVELHLVQAGVVARIPGERVLLVGECLVEHLAYAVERAGEVAAAAHLLAVPAGPREQVVEPASSLRSLAEKLAQRLPQARAGQHLAAQLVECLADVVRRGQRVRSAVPGAVSHSSAGHC
jgi:hypothetical protein